MAHGGDQLAYDDLPAARGRRGHSQGQPVADSLDGLRRGEAGLRVLLRRPTRLAVDHPVGGQVLDELSRNPAEILRALHDRDGVVERPQIVDQRARVAGVHEPAAKCLGVIGRKLVPDLACDLDDRLGPQPAVEMIMQGDLR